MIRVDAHSARRLRSVAVAGLLSAGVALPSAAFAQTAPSAVSGNANVKSDALRQAGGWRASKEIGTSVYNDQNQQVGTIDDLILSGDNKVQMVVISVGGFLGMGSKLVAVPPDRLHFPPSAAPSSERKVMMTGATKEALNAQPSFKYEGS